MTSARPDSASRREAELLGVIASLEERVERLTQELADARRASSWQMPLQWGLSPSKGKLMAALVERPIVSKDDLHAVLYRDDPDGGPDDKIICVFIRKIRRKIGPFGWSIATFWREGYWIPAEQRELIKAGAVRSATL